MNQIFSAHGVNDGTHPTPRHLPTDLPDHVEVVVVGGGIIGCSTAFHLARDHGAQTLVLESGELTGGTTFHAAGLVGQLRSSASVTQLLKYSVELYDGLEAETGLTSGWKRNGGLRLANNSSRWTEIKRQATTAHSFGLEMELLSPTEAKALWPLMDHSDLIGAAFMPGDGQANPSDITLSLAKGAQNHGALIRQGVVVHKIETVNGAVTGVVTNRGRIGCEKVVICAGQWSKQLGLNNQVSIPLQSMSHQYMLSDVLPGVTSDLPTLRDPDRLIYFKEEVGGLVMGGYEPNPKPWLSYPVPEDFRFSLLDEDWGHFEQLMEQALIRVPSLGDVGVKSLVNGPESFTIDGNFILGEAPEVKNYFVGTGFNAFGIASAGGAGMALASWVASGEQPMDLWSVDIRRFSDLHRDHEWIRERTIEACSKHYTMAWPNEEYDSARPRLVSPLYDDLKLKNACFGSKLGWERANWFAPGHMDAIDSHSFGRANWFDSVGREHLACRDTAALFDQSSFAKFELVGEDACAELNRICANNIDRAVGTVIYTQLLNSRGGIEADLTVTRIEENHFYLVTGTGFRTHDKSWIERNLSEGARVRLIDVTEDWATLSLMGPKSRDILNKLTDHDLSNRAFPFSTMRSINIAGQAVRALRMTYVGELGWELHLPIAGALSVYRAIWRGSENQGLVSAGYRAIESLRLEKGYRAWSADITPSDTPFEAGLGWAVKQGSGIDFIGKDALSELVCAPLTKRLCCFTNSNFEVVLNGRETIFRDGVVVGYTSSAGWGYSVRKNIAYGYVRSDREVTDEFLLSGNWELEVACERIPFEVALATLYDPKMAKIKC